MFVMFQCFFLADLNSCSNVQCTGRTDLGVWSGEI